MHSRGWRPPNLNAFQKSFCSTPAFGLDLQRVNCGGHSGTIGDGGALHLTILPRTHGSLSTVVATLSTAQVNSVPSFDGPAGAAVLGLQPSAQPSLWSPSCLNKKQNPSLPPGDAWELEGIRLLTAKIEASFALEKMTVRRAASRGGWGG